MTEKKYLRWYNKAGYGAGDIAGNVVYALLSSFVMIFLTNMVGLSSGIVGTLIAVSKLFDGVTDIFFGALIDKTHTKMGKARPWMLWGYVGCAVTLAAIFFIPADMSAFTQYAWFFITYTLLNAVFYTANNIAYSALTALVTKNSGERVQMGSIRFMFAFGTSLLIQSVTVQAVAALGGGAAGWRWMAIIYAVIGLVTNTLSVLSVKELPEEELAESAEAAAAAEEKYTLADAAKLLCANRYYFMICVAYVLMQIYTATINMGIYYMTFVLGNENLLGVFSWAINIPLIIGLMLTPVLVERFHGMYRLNIGGYIIGTAGRALVIFAGYLHNIPLMLVFSGVAALGMSPLQGDLNALIASCSEYTFLTKGKRVDGTMYSCTSLGVKIGGGLGTAMCGWLLEWSGYNGLAAIQTASCLNMLHVMYLWIPMVINLLITFLLFRLNVESENQRLKDARRLAGAE